MSNQIDEFSISKKLIALIGTKITVGLSSTGEKLSGTVENAMFDSFLLNSNGTKIIVRVQDLTFLEEEN